MVFWEFSYMYSYFLLCLGLFITQLVHYGIILGEGAY